MLIDEQRTERVEKFKYLLFMISSKWDYDEGMRVGNSIRATMTKGDKFYTSHISMLPVIQDNE